MTKGELFEEIHEYICERSEGGQVFAFSEVTKLFAERYPEFTFSEVDEVMQA